MSKFFFYDYIDYEEGRMAHVCTTDMNEIPLNIHIDNDDEFPDLKDRECEINVVRLIASQAILNAATSNKEIIGG